MPRRILKISGIIIVMLVAAAALFAGWLSFGKPSNLQTKAYRTLPYPAVMVGGKTILAKDFFHRIDIAKKTTAGEGDADEEEIKKQVYDRLVDEQKANILAGKKDLEITDGEVSEQYRDTIEQLSGGKEDDFKKMLEQYGMNENEFKNQVLRPDLIFTKLIVWYNSQRNFNSGVYAKVDEITEKLKDASTTFESLVPQYSSDEQDASMQGDLGFVEVGKLLPEFKDSFNDTKPGDSKVVASRFGVHYFKIGETDDQGENSGRRIQLKQILLEPQGFEQWYKEETKNYSVRRFIKI
jgi:parvulin-like peptidyl-prolyl isomerase